MAGERLVQSFELQQGVAPVVEERRRIVGFAPYCAIVAGKRVFRPPQVQRRFAPAVESFGRAGFEPQRAFIHRQRVLGPLQIAQGIASIHQNACPGLCAKQQSGKPRFELPEGVRE